MIENNEATDSMNIPLWSPYCSKLATPKLIEFVINKCIESNIFPDELKKCFMY